jgi:hypothetical protein
MLTRSRPPSIWRGTQIPWAAATIFVAGSGVACSEWLHLSNERRFPVLAQVFMMLASLAAAALVAIIARQAAIRAAVTAELVQALHQILGWPEPSHGIIAASRWQSAPTRHGIGPNAIRMNYTPAASTSIKQQSAAARLRSDTDASGSAEGAGANPEWLRLINSTLAETLGQPYQLSVDRKKWRLTATPSTEEPENDEPSAVRRLRSMMTSLFGASATITDYTIDDKGRITRFVVKHDIPIKLADAGPGRIHRMERTVSKVLPGRWRGDFKLTEDIVIFELRPKLPKLLWPRIYPEAAGVADAIATYKNTRIIYAYDEDRRPISWHPKTVPHRLMIGPTGSGKTSSIHTFITQIARAHWAVNIADRKNVEYRGFRSWPNVQCVATRIEDQIALIHHIWLLMKQRYEAGETGAARTEDFTPVLLVLDEFTELVKDIASWYIKLRASYPASETKKWPRELPTEEEVGSLLRLGRTARIHVIIGMQRPDVKYVEGENRDNLTGRQSLGRIGRNGADMLWGDYYTGTTIPPGLLGRGMAYNDHGDPVEVQNFFTPDPYKPDDLKDPTAERVLEALRPTSCSHPRIVFDTPLDPHADTDFTPADYLDARMYFAADRPDLDPLSPEYRFKPRATADATTATTALAPRNNTASIPTPIHKPDTRRDEPNDRWPGYGQPAPRHIDALQVGDLICVDPGAGIWAILEQAPEPDLVDPDSLTLSVRDANDDFDLLTVPLDSSVISRPLLDDDEQCAA